MTVLQRQPFRGAPPDLLYLPKPPFCYFTHTRSAQRDPTGPLQMYNNCSFMGLVCKRVRNLESYIVKNYTKRGQLDRDRRQSTAHAQRLLSTSSSEGQLGRRATVGGRGEGLGGGGGGALGTAGEHGEPRKQQLVQQRAAAAPRAADPREQFGQGRGGEHSWERRGSGRGERRRRRRRRRKRRRKAGERSSLTRKCAHLRRARRCCSLVRTSRKWVCRTCEILGYCCKFIQNGRVQHSDFIFLFSA